MTDVIQIRSVGGSSAPTATLSGRGFTNDGLGVGPQNILNAGEILVMFVEQMNRNSEGAINAPSFTTTSEAWTLLASAVDADTHNRLDVYYVQLANSYGDAAWQTDLSFSGLSKGLCAAFAVRGIDPGDAASSFFQASGSTVDAQHDDIGITMATAQAVGTSQTPDSNWGDATDGSFMFFVSCSHSSTVGATATYQDAYYNQLGIVGGGAGSSFCFGAGVTNECFSAFQLAYNYGSATGASSMGVSPFRFDASAQTDLCMVAFEIAAPIPPPPVSASFSLSPGDRQ